VQNEPGFQDIVGAIYPAGVGIPLRCYLMSAVGFDYQRLGEKFRQIFPFVLALDQLWAIAPFLLIEKIGLGAAFAAISSTSVFHAPHTSQRPAHLGWSAPHSVQR
jgi:hypothetical protein